MYCTYAATGKHPSFQPIYVCVTCSELKSVESTEQQRPLHICVCQNCAVECHESLGHTVDFIGYGDSYCDCPLMCRRKEREGQQDNGGEHTCALQSSSEAIAKKLGLCADGCLLNVDIDKPSERDLSISHHTPIDGSNIHFPYMHEVFTIPELLPTEPGIDVVNMNECIIHQAKELIKHTSDTHFILYDPKAGDGCIQENEKMCLLERLAWSIFQRHVKENELQSYLTRGGGAEWWVQVKNQDLTDQKDGAIDLHYDKDEELAAAFDLGSFPSLSTVTYLTDSLSPTLVFAHEYNMPLGPLGGDSHKECDAQMLISYPTQGKHLLFDGRLLHGVPNLRQYGNHQIMQKLPTQSIRVTFLVNIWLTRTPCVKPLASDVRSKIKVACPDETMSADITFQPRKWSSLHVANIQEDHTIDNEQHRVHLPFVSKGATWIDDDDHDEDSGLVVSMHLPSMSMLVDANDAAVVRYDSPIAPRLESLEEESEEEEE